jgi:predicted metal-dependent phosphoesterase TrpH
MRKNEFVLAIDLHVHTKYSGDSSITPKELVDQLHVHLFIKGVAITDHDTISGYWEVSKLAKAYDDILIIPGIEVSVESGHLIILGIEECPSYPSSIESVIDFARERGGTVIIPHPYRELGLGDIAEDIGADAVEVLNPHATQMENKKAENLARKINLPCVAGSDAHSLQEMWIAYTKVEARQEVDDILKVIKNGRVKVATTKQ